MTCSLIAAMSIDGILGSSTCQNQHGLLWDVPADRRHFFHTTRHKTILYGRKTFDAMGQKPLPNRRNLILSRQTKRTITNCEVISDLKALSNTLSETEDLMICGGAQIYQLALEANIVDTLIISLIPGLWQGDVYFPRLNWNDWQVQESSKQKGFILQIWSKIRKPFSA